MKALFWVGSSLEDVRAFPEDARSIAGHNLRLVQQGLEPDDWKVLPSVGPEVHELRIRARLEHRVFYVAKFSEGVYVLHAVQKKTQKIPRKDLDLARERYKEVVSFRREDPTCRLTSRLLQRTRKLCFLAAEQQRPLHGHNERWHFSESRLNLTRCLGDNPKPTLTTWKGRAILLQLRFGDFSMSG
jgi:phage-related protein